MMKHKYSVVFGSSGIPDLRRLCLSRGWARWLALTGIAVTVLVNLACASLVAPSDRIVKLNHLPTFTRTPLPPLIPVPTSTPLIGQSPPETTSLETTQLSEPGSQAIEAAVPTTVSQGLPPTTVAAGPAGADEAKPIRVPSPVNSETPPAVAAANPTASPSPTLNLPITTLEPVPVETPRPSDTATSTATALPLPTSIPTATPTEESTPTSTPTPTETPIPIPEGWVFSGVRSVPMPGGRYLLVHGLLFNNTGVTQTLNEIKLIFPDDLALTGANNYRSFYPITQIPHGGRIPFKLLIAGETKANEFDLEVVASEGGNSPPQEFFEFLEVSAVTAEDEYCVVGKLRNTGDELGDYLVVAAVLYDGEDKIINYSLYDEETPRDLAGDQTRQISICIDPLNQEVARYELQAWGL